MIMRFVAYFGLFRPEAEMKRFSFAILSLIESHLFPPLNQSHKGAFSLIGPS
jgi:hypothetical protein